MSDDTATIITTGNDDDLGEVTITRDFDFPREMLFAAFIDPEQLTHFWGPPGISTPVDKITIDELSSPRLASTKARFASLDADKNGSLTREEFAGAGNVRGGGRGGRNVEVPDL